MSDVYVQVPKHTKELAKSKLEHGGLSRVVREKLTQVAHGAETSERERIKDNLQELRDDRRQLKNKREAINDKLEELEIKIQRAEDRLDDLRDKEGEYEGALQMIEDEMHEQGARVFPEHKAVERAARLGECDELDVIRDLEDRNPDLPEEQFSTEI